MPLLSIRDLQVSYRTDRGEHPAVRGVSLDLEEGQTLAVVGQSGSGKTTFAKALLRLLPPHAEQRASSISFAGTELAGTPERVFRRSRGTGIGYIPQDSAVSLNPVSTIGHQLARVAKRFGKATAKNADVIVQEALHDVGIADPALRAAQYPHQLSGGTRQRALIAMALIAEPRLLVADEPTSALDVVVQQQILDLLLAAAHERKLATILITHDLALAGDRADQLIIMHEGEVVESGATSTVLSNPQHPYTRRLLAAAPTLGSAPLIARRSAGTRQDDAERPAEIVRAAGVNKSFVVAGKHIDAVIDANLRIETGTTLALVGESGSGKSTLSRIVSGLERKDSGQLTVSGIDLTSAKRTGGRELWRSVQFVHQDPYTALNPAMTVRHILADPLRKRGDKASSNRISTLLHDVGLDEAIAARRPGELSGGQRQRVSIARALASQPQLLVLDEPVSALDVLLQEQLLRLLTQLQQQLGLTYLFISHDLAVVRLVADRVAVMRHGRIVEENDTDTLFAAPAHPYTRELLRAIPGQHPQGQYQNTKEPS